MVALFLTFRGTPQPNFHNGCINLHDHQQWIRIPLSSSSSPTFVVRLLNNWHSEMSKYLKVVFSYILLVTRDNSTMTLFKVVIDSLCFLLKLSFILLVCSLVDPFVFLVFNSWQVFGCFLFVCLFFCKFKMWAHCLKRAWGRLSPILWAVYAKYWWFALLCRNLNFM